MDESKCFFRLALKFVSGVGDTNLKLLVQEFGSAEAVFKQSKKDLLAVHGVGQKLAQQLLSKTTFSAAEKQIKVLLTKDTRILWYEDADYPSRLKHFLDSPALLFVRGEMDLNVSRSLAIVGTRKPTDRAKKFCRDLIDGLSIYEPSIISGLAYGIDICAHKACLSQGLDTIAVLAHGLHTIYPAVHLKTAQAIIKQGCLLSEFELYKKPDRENFPKRNRIIAGMSDAVIVLETPKRGGSMITAQIANNYNKDVFALPGRVEDGNSVGCNHLIKSHRAALFESADDIAYVLGWTQEKEKKQHNPFQKSLFPELTFDQDLVIQCLIKKHETGVQLISVDAIAHETQIRIGLLNSILLGLQLMGLVREEVGKRFRLEA